MQYTRCKVKFLNAKMDSLGGKLYSLERLLERQTAVFTKSSRAISRQFLMANCSFFKSKCSPLKTCLRNPSAAFSRRSFQSELQCCKRQKAVFLMANAVWSRRWNFPQHVCSFSKKVLAAVSHLRFQLIAYVRQL